MIEITSKQRKVLEKAAHSLEPVVIVGQNGVTDSLTEKVAQSLEAHELIKVKFNDFKDDKRELTENLCNFCGALLVRIIGNIAILYKEQENPEKRKIK
ncbi:ribosome assembly RNA-binding protein YhbY, partial [uncultured Treponema sp.]